MASPLPVEHPETYKTAYSNVCSLPWIENDSIDLYKSAYGCGRLSLAAGTIGRSERCDMTYEQAMGARVSKSEAIAEVRLHPTGQGTELDISDFLIEVGDKAQYTGAEVLDWLGY